MLTVLSLAGQVADDLGMAVPRSLFASAPSQGDTNDAKLRRALIKTCRFLHRHHDWPALRAEYEFQASWDGSQIGALPADYSRMVKGTLIDRTHNQRLYIVETVPPRPVGSGGPHSSRPTVVLRGTDLSFTTPHALGTVVAFEYVRNSIGSNGQGRLIAEFSGDDDTTLWPDELVHLGMVWAIQHRDGNQSNEDYDAFAQCLRDEMTYAAPDVPLVFGPVHDSDYDDIPGYPLTQWGL